MTIIHLLRALANAMLKNMGEIRRDGSTLNVWQTVACVLADAADELEEDQAELARRAIEGIGGKTQEED